MDSTPGASTSEEICISRRTLVNFYRECSSRKDSDRMQFLYNKVANALHMTTISSDIKSLLSKLINNYKGKLEKCHRNFERCMSGHKDWFDAYISFAIPAPSSKKRSGSSGRPTKDFDECSERSKRQKTEDLRSKFTPAELSYAAQMTFRACGDLEKSKQMKDICEDNVQKILPKEHKTLSADRALSIVIEGKLTKHQYNIIRTTALGENCTLYPNYERVTNAKKMCYPSGISCTETTAEVPLQNLLNHTAERLLLSLNELISSLDDQKKQHLFLVSKWGCDGSGSHSQYKQKFQDADCTDEYMFITSIVPIRLIYKDGDKVEIIWQNPRPSSPRYCRLLKLQMVHETTELSITEAGLIRDQISVLIPTKGEDWCISHDLKLTMVDGKMVNALTHTSSAMRCYLCGLTSRDFNKLKLCINKPINRDHLEYGISSLHAWIRLAECILHLAYKLKTGKWQARTENDKKNVSSEKKRIQQEFWEKLGLHVDKPRQGGGTSTDGNTAREIFNNAEETAEITGVHLNIIKRFHSILKLLSSGYKIDTQKFNQYCQKTASMFVLYYPWYPMPTTLHKILIHGSVIVENMGIAIGLLSEDAQESRNKDVRNYREQFSRKFSRKLAMTDTFQRLMVSSDPYITGLRKLVPRKPLTLNTIETSLLDENLDI